MARVFVFLAVAAPLLVNAQLNCSNYMFNSNFSDAYYKDQWKLTSGKMVGNISAIEGSPTGMQLTVNTKNNASAITLQSHAWFMPPTNFTFEVEAAQASGVMSALTVWQGNSTDSEIDLELQGWSEKQDQVMLPIWYPGHAAEPIPLANGPKGWPASSDGATATFTDFTASPNNRYVVTKKGYSTYDRHTYTLVWLEDSITWYVEDQMLAQFNRGNDQSLWPVGPMPLSIGVWTGAPNDQGSAAWLGPYEYDPSNPATFKIYNIEATSSCMVNSTQELEDARDSALSLSISALACTLALFLSGLTLFA